MESMSGRSTLIATNEQKSALAELVRSDLRGEAGRARAILLSLAVWTGPEIAEAFGVTTDSVRHWRQRFAEGGVEALRSTLAPGQSAEKGEQALAVARAVLERIGGSKPSGRPDAGRQGRDAAGVRGFNFRSALEYR